MTKKGVLSCAALTAALCMAVVSGGCSSGCQKVNTSADRIESFNQNIPDIQTSEKEIPITKAPSETYQETSETVYVVGDRVNLRRAGGTDSPVIGRVNKGTEMRRTGIGNQWSRVEYQGQICYISSQYLSASQPVQETKPVQEAKPVENQAGEVRLNPEWQYAGFSKINSGTAMLYKAENNRKDIVVCVNAGHGTKGGSSVKTQCHPDGTPKVTGGTTQAGATTAVAVSGGMEFSDGTPESRHGAQNIQINESGFFHFFFQKSLFGTSPFLSPLDITLNTDKSWQQHHPRYQTSSQTPLADYLKKMNLVPGDDRVCFYRFQGKGTVQIDPHLSIVSAEQINRCLCTPFLDKNPLYIDFP